MSPPKKKEKKKAYLKEHYQNHYIGKQMSAMVEATDSQGFLVVEIETGVEKITH